MFILKNMNYWHTSKACYVHLCRTLPTIDTFENNLHLCLVCFLLFPQCLKKYLT